MSVIAETGASPASGFWSDIPRYVARWTPITTLYFILLGIVHQTGYWGEFNVNVMAYMGLQDIVRVSALPLLFAAIVTVVIAGYWSLLDRLHPHLLRTLRGSRLRTFISGAVLLIVFATVVLLALWNLIPIWFLLGGAIITGLFAVTLKSSILSGVGTAFVRALTLAVLVLAPYMALTMGKFRADRVLNATVFDEALLPISVLRDLTGVDIDGPVYYLGHVNDYDFFWSKNRTLVLRSQAIPAFSYEHHRNVDRLRIPFRDPLIPQPR